MAKRILGYALKLTALITVYNEAKFLDCCLESIKDHVDSIVVVEGSYQENIRLGKPPRSEDETEEVIHKFMDRNEDKRITLLHYNEESDAQQRNAGLEEIKDQKDIDFCMIVDGDEVYTPEMFKLIKAIMRTNQDVFYHTCRTFVGDFNTYCKQQFPRLFRLYEDTEFTNDNFVRSNGKEWPDLSKTIINLQYFHYGFLKGNDKFLDKKKWWESRFGKGQFNYDWYVDTEGKITPTGHDLYQFTGKHPKVVQDKFGL